MTIKYKNMRIFDKHIRMAKQFWGHGSRGFEGGRSFHFFLALVAMSQVGTNSYVEGVDKLHILKYFCGADETIKEKVATMMAEFDDTIMNCARAQ